MKTFPLKLTDEVHKALKLRAAKNGTSLHYFIVESVMNELTQEDCIEASLELHACKHERGFSAAGNCKVLCGYNDKITKEEQSQEIMKEQFKTKDICIDCSKVIDGPPFSFDGRRRGNSHTKCLEKYRKTKKITTVQDSKCN